MAELFGRFRWAMLLDIIDQLPRHSRLSEAQSNDDELAEHIIKSEMELPKSKVRLSEFDGVREEIMLAVDRLGQLINIEAQKVLYKPRPRPVTAIERARERKRYENHNIVISKFLPHKSQN